MQQCRVFLSFIENLQSGTVAELNLSTKWFIIKELCNKKNISVSELARRIGQTPQNFGKKLKRDTVTLEELKQIADVMEVTFEQSFIFPDGEQIKTSNE